MKTFQQLYNELESIVQEFESDSIDLDRGLKRFEEGLKIASELQKRLNDTDNKLEVLKKKFSIAKGEINKERDSD